MPPRAETSAYSDLISNLTKAVFFRTLKSIKKMYPEIFNIEDGTLQQEKENSISGLGILQIQKEGAPLQYDTPELGYAFTYNQVRRSLGFRITKEMQIFDRFDVMKKMPAELAKSVVRTVEVVAANVFNLGTSTSMLTGGDGQPLFSTAHPMRYGGTQANMPATPGDLSVTTLREMLLMFDDWVDHKGNDADIECREIWVPKENRFKLYELLKSAQKPETANNEINAFKDENIVGKVWKRLTDPDCFIGLASKQDHKLKLKWKLKGDPQQETDFDTGDYKVKDEIIFAIGFTDWLGVAYNPGA